MRKLPIPVNRTASRHTLNRSIKMMGLSNLPWVSDVMVVMRSLPIRVVSILAPWLLVARAFFTHQGFSRQF